MPPTSCGPLVLECLGSVHEGCEVLGEGREYFPQSVASGEPEARGVLLWTRAVDPAHPGADVRLRLQVARDEHFHQCVLEARGLRTTCAHDHTLKVRLTGLEPCTHYYYRFIVEREGRELGSPVGRTRTSGACARERPIHFVVASYEELLGHEHGRWQRLLQREEDPDFILFVEASLGEDGPEADAGALQSVSRFRDLHRTYRSNPFLQQLHARYPFVVLGEESREGADPARLASLEYLPVEDARFAREEERATGRAARHLRLLVSSAAAAPEPSASTTSRWGSVPPGLRRRGEGGRAVRLGASRRMSRRP